MRYRTSSVSEVKSPSLVPKTLSVACDPIFFTKRDWLTDSQSLKQVA